MNEYEKFKQALVDMGDTSEKISSTLQAKGIKGKKGTCNNCPVANYLTSLGFSKVAVGTVEVLYEDYERNDACVNLPDAIAKWVEEFDLGKHSEFIQDDTI